MSEVIKAYENPNHEGNSEKYHTGKYCIEDGCFRRAGTAWGPYWCVEHNIKRIEQVHKDLEVVSGRMEADK